MDIISSITSIFSDVAEANQNLKDLLIRHNVLIDKFQRFFNESKFRPDERVEKEGFEYLITKSTKLYEEGKKKLQGMNLANKLLVGTNLDRTKVNIEKSISDLQNAIQELKQKMERDDGSPQKREATVSIRQTKQIEKPYVKLPQTLFDPMNYIAATLQDNYQTQTKKRYLFQLNMKIVGPQSLLDLIGQKKLQSSKFTKSMLLEDPGQETIVYSFDRSFFLPVLLQIQKHNIAVNYISSKNPHFNLILKKQWPSNYKTTQKQQQKQQSIVYKFSPQKPEKKQSSSRKKGKNLLSPRSQQQTKQTECSNRKSKDAFQSFQIAQTVSVFDPQLKIFLRNQSTHKIYYQRGKEPFLPIQQDFKLQDGDRITPLMLKPDFKIPLVIIELSFGLYLQE